MHVKIVGFPLSLLFLGILSFDTEDEEYINILRNNVFKECSIAYPISKEMRDNARKGVLPTNYNFSCYVKCAFQKFFLINAMTGINGDALITLHKNQFNGLIYDVVKKCLPIKKSSYYSCESIFGFVKCAVGIDKRAIEFVPI